MTDLYHTEDEPQYICWDRANYSSFEDQLNAIKNSKTVYVGNLSFFTKESQILETFSTAGPVKRIIMGLNNLTKTPCGFCFVEYYHQEHTDNALKYLTETVCDERLIRCDADGGFLPGRQFGRGKSGGQIRDERRFDYDPARGRFIPPAILGHQRYRDYRNNNNGNRGGGGSHGNFRRTSSRDDGGRDDRHYGSNKRSRRNYEGNYHQSSDRYDDRNNRHDDDNNNNDGERDERDYDHRRKHHNRRNNHHQQQYNPHYQPQYQRQNSGDMEVSLHSSLDTPRD